MLCRSPKALSGASPATRWLVGLLGPVAEGHGALDECEAGLGSFELRRGMGQEDRSAVAQRICPRGPADVPHPVLGLVDGKAIAKFLRVLVQPLYRRIWLHHCADSLTLSLTGL
jgi:hypothetical protein